MSNIREFRNSDLPALAKVWVAHWSRCGPPPNVNIPMMEQAVLSRTFFDASTLLVAENEGDVQAWCHFYPEPNEVGAAKVCTLCFTDAGLESTDQLLKTAESKITERGLTRITVGTVRDQSFGYSGLSPIGHGFGIPADDQATTTLLGSRGYTRQMTVERMVAQTNPYRMPVSRDALQFRRATRMAQRNVIPDDTRRASALSNFDIVRFILVDQRSAAELAAVELWLSDPEAQVMPGSDAILDLSTLQSPGELSPPQRYLIGAVLQSLTDRRISIVETPVDSDQVVLLTQLAKLQFRSLQQGACWEKQAG